MLIILESPVGLAIFKAEKKLKHIRNLAKEFTNPEVITNLVNLQSFLRFTDTKDAMLNSSSLVEGKIGKKLKKFLKHLQNSEASEQLVAVCDTKLAQEIKKHFDGLSVVSDTAIVQLRKAIMSNLPSFIPDITESDLTRSRLGLSHSLDRYKLKCNPDKIDTMIIQAISLLDDTDKEINNYMMRCKEMYGWHFPELSKLITDNTLYIKTIARLDTKEDAATKDLSDLLDDETIRQVREAAITSCGNAINVEDIDMIRMLGEQILQMTESRTMLYEYLQTRMQVVAPNLTAIVGELLGARLISHAGTLVNLAKYPSSTAQILGAEKALFRALKLGQHTPKYGLMYHAQLVSQASQQFKGRVSRMTANKVALAARIDALGNAEANQELLGKGLEYRSKVEYCLKLMEQGKYNTKLMKRRQNFGTSLGKRGAETPGRGGFKKMKRSFTPKSEA